MEIPTVLDHVISKCLEKNREDRWQSAHDVAEELKWIASGQAVDQTHARPRPWPLWAAVAFLTLLAVATTALYVGERNKRREPVSFEILPPPQHSFDDSVISPDGKAIAFHAATRSGEPEEAIWIRHLASLQAIKITDKGAVKESDLAVTGDAQKIIDDVYFSEDGAHSFASVANDGAILYRPASRLLSHREVGWYDRTGRLIEKLFEDVSIADFRLSPDESKIAMTRIDRTKGADDIYSFDLTRGVNTKISSGLSDHSSPSWSPAGDRIFFNSDRDGMYDIYAQSEDGTSPAEAIWKGGDDKSAMDVSPDGKSMLAGLYSAKTRDDIWLVPLTAGEKPKPLVATDGADDGARFLGCAITDPEEAHTLVHYVYGWDRKIAR